MLQYFDAVGYDIPTAATALPHRLICDVSLFPLFERKKERKEVGNPDKMKFQRAGLGRVERRKDRSRARIDVAAHEHGDFENTGDVVKKSDERNRAR